MKNILLSADGDISLYLIKEELFEIIEELVKEFDISNNTNCFDEKKFVKFLCEKYGNECIKFVKIVGKCNAGDYNEEIDKFDDLIEDEYKNVKLINF